MPGISGLSLYLPRYRVELQQWSDWNNQSWNKIRHVVGDSFRMRGPEQSVYTFAANAAWRLINAYDIDPSEVGFFALGTESSSDNSAGAIIVKGMLNDALLFRGKPLLARDCEVPEFKHACLGGVYAIKSALRYLATDGVGRKAIVVCSDIAEYARGSSGEPTQGAGAVAILLESDPTMLEIDLAGSGNDSNYRHVDFRKPFARFRGRPLRDDGQIQDLPVFNGRYSTNCYVDATHYAVKDMLTKRPGRSVDYFDDVDAVFMHRPYHRMPISGWEMAYLFALVGDEKGRTLVGEYCDEAGLDADALFLELDAEVPIETDQTQDVPGTDAYPLARQLRKHLAGNPEWTRAVDEKLALGRDAMRDLGNLYTAALPAWIAAGLSEAATQDAERTGQEWLALGYGSGDASEALPMKVMPGWRQAASAINFEHALAGPIDLTEEQYVAFHDGRGKTVITPSVPDDEFVIDHVGISTGPEFYDHGVEYYRYVPTTP